MESESGLSSNMDDYFDEAGCKIRGDEIKGWIFPLHTRAVLL